MTNIAFIHRPTLAAVNLAASNEETRYYLRGVLVEIEPQQVTYVATDGHRLIARRVANREGETNSLLGSFIIPSETIKTIKVLRGRSAWRNSDAWGKLKTDPDGSTGLLALTFDISTDIGIVFFPVDGTYPDWRRVVPRDTENRESGRLGATMTYQWHFLTDFEKAADILELGSLIFKPFNDGSPEIIRFESDKDTFGIIMPVRYHSPKDEVSAPDWSDYYRHQYKVAAE